MIFVLLDHYKITHVKWEIVRIKNGVHEKRPSRYLPPKNNYDFFRLLDLFKITHVKWDVIGGS